MDEEKNQESTDPKAEELSQDDLKQVSGGNGTEIKWDSIK